MFRKADLIFTGGHSLYEAKKNLHDNIYSFPSSIEKEHFSLARHINVDPADQANIPHPRIGFFGVIDERMNIDLIRKNSRTKTRLAFCNDRSRCKNRPGEFTTGWKTSIISVQNLTRNCLLISQGGISPSSHSH